VIAFDRIYDCSLADNTLSNYNTGWKKLEEWSDVHRVTILPISIPNILCFLVYLWPFANFPTITSTIKAIRHFHYMNCFTDPFAGPGEAIVKRLIRAFKKESPKPDKKVRLPLTVHLLNLFIVHNLVSFATHDDRCCWAACCVAVWGLLRAGEFLKKTTKKVVSFLRLGDLTMFNNKAILLLRSTKTMLWNDVIPVHIFKIKGGCFSCPFTALSRFLGSLPVTFKHTKECPLFILVNGKPLDRETIVKWIRSKIIQLERILGFSLSSEKFNGISFRKGGAQSARKAGTGDGIIRVLGRWSDSSVIFRTYISVSEGERELAANRIAEHANQMNEVDTEVALSTSVLSDALSDESKVEDWKANHSKPDRS
jgi:hypothetical protein